MCLRLLGPTSPWSCLTHPQHYLLFGPEDCLVSSKLLFDARWLERASESIPKKALFIRDEGIDFLAEAAVI